MTKFKTTIDDIFHVVCMYYGTSMDELCSLSRKGEIVRARAVFFYLCRKYTTSSYNTISTTTCRDHATAMHHYKKLDGYMTKEEKDDVEEIKSLLFNKSNTDYLWSMNNLGRYFGIIKDVEFAVWN